MRLTAPATEHEWLSLRDGVRLELRPLEPVTEIAATRAGAQAMRDMREAGHELDWSAYDWAYYRELALRLVAGWEGVEDAEGKPAPVTRENVELLLRQPGVAVEWRTAILVRQAERAEEKKSSMISPPGTGAATAAPSTARDAVRRVPRAPAASPGAALMSSTSP